MPHNWASAEFIRAVTRLLVFERGDELHLFEGLPPTWLRPNAEISIRNMLTRFGPFSMVLRVSDDGRTAALDLKSPKRKPPERIVVHKGKWAAALKMNGEMLADGYDAVIPDAHDVRIILELAANPIEAWETNR